MKFSATIAVCFLLVLTSCALKTPQMHIRNSFDKQGHRGCRGLMPENTIAAMKRALDLGVTTLEMDVVITKDGEVVLSHEPFFNHQITTKPDGDFVREEEEKFLNIYRMNYSEIEKFDIGLKPHPRFLEQQKIAATKPLLRALIDSIKTYCLVKIIPLPQFNIEIKSQPLTDNVYHPSPDVFATKLINVIREKKIEKNTIVQSFDMRSLQYIHDHFNLIKTGLLIEDFDKRTLEQQLNALGFIPTVYSPHYSLVTVKLIDSCHQKNMLVVPWTVNNLVEMKKLVELKVDGVITDYPNLFKELELL